jgi:16S rRNA processing protein RimM
LAAAQSPSLLAVGRVLRPHGVRGDLLLASLTDFPEHLGEIDTVYLGEKAEPHAVAAFRQHRGQLLLKLAGVPDRDSADAFRGQLVQIRRQAAAPLPAGNYYHHDILGLSAVTDEGERLGEVVEIIETGANDVYVVRGEAGEILLPAIRSVILEISLAKRQITVHLIDGLR